MSVLDFFGRLQKRTISATKIMTQAMVIAAMISNPVLLRLPDEFAAAPAPALPAPALEPVEVVVLPAYVPDPYAPEPYGPADAKYRYRCSIFYFLAD